MKARTWALAAMTMALACGGGSDEPTPDTVRMTTQAPPPAIDAGAGADGGVDGSAAAAATPTPTRTGRWVDPVPARGAGWAPGSGSRTARKRRIVQLTLRSTPPGAVAMVDGVTIGFTPTYWEGEATGKARNFVFTKRGYAMARHRFVPTTDGIVHPTLKKLVSSEVDAGPEPSPR